MPHRLVIAAVSVCAICCYAQAPVCAPPSDLQAELQKAAAVPIQDRFAEEENTRPFRELRNKYSDNVFAHERYQDAVQEHGIEGHLRDLALEYQALQAQHPDDAIYSYLQARALAGRATTSAIQNLTGLLNENPNFAPAHRTLAEIYSTHTFRNDELAAAEKAKYLSLCPGGAFTKRPPALTGWSPLLEQAGNLLAQGAEPDRVLAMAEQALREDEWRNQKIRSLDWYTVEEKRAATTELLDRHWRHWELQVQCYRKAGRTVEAAAVLRTMERASERLRKDSDVFWRHKSTIAMLYLEANQPSEAKRTLDAMAVALSTHPDPAKAEQLESLRRRSQTEQPAELVRETTGSSVPAPAVQDKTR